MPRFVHRIADSRTMRLSRCGSSDVGSSVPTETLVCVCVCVCVCACVCVCCAQATEANIRGGFAAMSMEQSGNLSFLAPELIAKGFRTLEQLHAAACKARDRGESLVRAFKIFQSSKTKPKGPASYLARLQDALDSAVRARQRALLDSSASASPPASGRGSASPTRVGTSRSKRSVA